MSTARRLYLSLVSGLCFVVLFSQTAHQADRAAHVQSQLTLSAEHPLKLASVLPAPARTDAALAAVAVPDAGAASALPWMLALGMLALALADASASLRLSALGNNSLATVPQRTIFSLRI